jgi:hypothetical protein
LLTFPGVDPSQIDNFPLKIACKRGFTEIVSLLLNHPSVNPPGEELPPICIRSAAELGHLQIVQMLLAQPKIDVAASDNAAFRYDPLSSLTHNILSD